jgi:hypothetical protein
MIIQRQDWLRVLSLVSGMALASVASAQSVPSVPKAPKVPSECSDSRNSKAWTSARTAGESRVNTVWKSNAVAQDLDKLSDALPSVLDSLQQYLVSLTSGSEPTLYTKCRAQGYTEGFVYRLNVLFNQCVLDGADWGQFAADLYCRLSVELGGLGSDTLFVRAPVGLCGNMFEATCEDVYRFVGYEGDFEVRPIVASYLTANEITLEPYPGCLPYTDGEYLEGFETSLHNDCTYQIAE